MTDAHHGSAASPHTVVDTIQSLIVAFVLAMTFRGFVTEGFVIPTGSMAPTLLGQHKRLRSDQSGWEFAIGSDPRTPNVSLGKVPDPMLGPLFEGSGTNRNAARTRMGDRILVLKSLYPFSSPSRFDVVVFKNPTNPNGEDGNYIKRLIGLPSESIWLADGDVFAAPAEDADDFTAYVVQRKPEHVQRAVWQPIFHSDYLPRRPEKLSVPYSTPWQGEGWTTDETPVFRCTTSAPTVLEWDNHVRTLDDWAPYNVLLQRNRRQSTVFVHDLRVAAAVVPEEAGLQMTLELEAREYFYEFIIGDGSAQLRMRPMVFGREEQPGEDVTTILPDASPATAGMGWTGPEPVAIDALQPGVPTDIEFWHVDQTMALFINGERVLSYEYDWRPVERLEHATRRVGGDPDEMAQLNPARPPMLRLRSQGSPLAMHRMRVDRDIFYRTDRLNQHAQRNPTQPEYIERVRPRTPAFGTHPDNLAVLGPDHFFMAGDNSTASSDSRLWGNPHPVVAAQIDDAPFVVNRRLLLGKAWVVYFPSPHSITEQGSAVIPDFGRLRFIR